MSVSYMADLHQNKRLFHGDIKPENIFICNDGNGFISSDSGSLTLLNDPSDKYFISLLTLGYSSQNHT
jgi:serine/threonine protein kinase